MTEALSPVQEAKTRAEAIEQAPVLFDAVTCRRCGQRFTSREVRDLHLKDCKGEPPAIKRTGITECFHCVHKQVCAVYDLIFAAEERAKRAGVLVHLMRNDCTGYKERY